MVWNEHREKFNNKELYRIVKGNAQHYTYFNIPYVVKNWSEVRFKISTDSIITELIYLFNLRV